MWKHEVVDSGISAYSREDGAAVLQTGMNGKFMAYRMDRGTRKAMYLESGQIAEYISAGAAMMALDTQFPIK